MGRGAAMRALALLLALAACAEAPRCASGLAPFTQATLYFGASTAVERVSFLRDVATRHFPAGFTVVDGEGAWRNPATGVTGQQKSWMLIALVPSPEDPLPAARALAEAWKAAATHRSVGIALAQSCAAF